MAKEASIEDADFLFVPNSDGSILRKVSLKEARRMSRIARSEIIAQFGKRQMKAFGGGSSDDIADMKIKDGTISF